MSDKEKKLIDGLIRRDSQITSAFLSGCGPMLTYVADKEQGGSFSLAEASMGFLEHLLSNDAALLMELLVSNSKDSFRKWLRSEARHYFELKNKNTTIESPSISPLCEKTRNSPESPNKQRTEMNITAMIDMVELERDRMVLERIDIDGMSYDDLEQETGLSKANLYNIRKRALERLKLKARVALGKADNLCALKCEQYAMEIFGMHKPLFELSTISEVNGWLTEEGVPREHVGKVSKLLGFSVRSRKGKFDDVINAIKAGEQVLAIVDGGELIGNPFDELVEDVLQGERADHCVVVLNCDIDKDEIMLFDPAFGDVPLTLSTYKFMDAWDDSGNLLIEIGNKTVKRACYDN